MDNLEPITPQTAALELLKRRRARESLAGYTEYVGGKPVPRHADLLCDKLDDLIEGKFNRLLVCMPPGHMKSWTCSRHFISRYMAKRPGHAVIHASHTQKLVARWGGIVRNIYNGPEHQKLYPGDQVTTDVRAADEWQTEAGSTYIAVGVDTAVQGRRGNLVVIDDPLRSFKDADSDVVRDTLWTWYGADISSRMFPDALVVLIQTRFHLDDLAGRLLAAARDGVGEPWEQLILPAMAKENDPLGRTEGEALWPEVYSIEDLERRKRQPAMTPRIWASLYQQSPVVDTGGIIDQKWFRVWRQPTPPACKFILQSWDTALTAGKESAFSACTTWGVFEEPETKVPAVILLSAWRGRLQWPELRRQAQNLGNDYLHEIPHLKPTPGPKRKPDTILVEAKANGQALVLDMQRAGLSAMRFNPDKYGDKTSRVRLITDLIEDGRVWVPGEAPGFTKPRKWAEEFIMHCGAFPATDSRDFVDTMTQALLRMKLSSWVPNTHDPLIEERVRIPGERRIYPA